MIDKTLLEIDNTEHSLILKFGDGMTHGVANEFQNHCSEVNLYLRRKFISHIAHSDQNVIDDTGILRL